MMRGLLQCSRCVVPSLLRPLQATQGVRAFRSNTGLGADIQYDRQVDPYPTPLTETIRDFLEPSEFYELLQRNGIEFFTGVPDSLLKDFCAHMTNSCPKNRHVIAANEGNAVAIAAGYHMATKKFPLVYMQNSGLGNSVNPLLSLADRHIYSIPMLLLIGWRGEPGKKDEPQHMVQGKVMSSMLADMNIKFEVLPDYIEGATEAVEAAVHHMEHRQAPYALLVRRQAFTKCTLASHLPPSYSLTREEALDEVLKVAGDWDVFVATTGFASREVYELRKKNDASHRQDFLCVGSMGHASSIALGIAIAKPSRPVFVLDGDGAALMHMGSFTTVGQQQPANFKHIVLNNGCYDSVGGQVTGSFDLDFQAIAKGSGYTHVATASSRDEIQAELKTLYEKPGPAMLEIRLNRGTRTDLGRPSSTPRANKLQFMRFLEG